MKHEKYDYSGYCGEPDSDHLTRAETIGFWLAIVAGVMTFAGVFAWIGYSVGSCA